MKKKTIAVAGRRQTSLGYRVFNVINVIILLSLSALCLFPLLHILAVSLSSQAPAAANEVVLWPVDFTWSSYKVVAGRVEFWRAFLVSIKRVVLGVSINTVLTVLLAYPLSKNDREFPGRKYYTWALIFVMIFNGGLVPTYLTVQKLGLLDTIWALVLPCAVPIYNVILTMNFMKQLPRSIEEAAFIDGASYFQSFIRIVLPISKPVIATVTLFSFLNHWNSWFDGLIYIGKSELYPLQTYMYNLISSRSTMDASAAIENALSNVKTLQCAQLFLTLLPILLIY
ncbi:MAG: carbohydrate ABC transporter permease, partial [Butyricicoccus sp.]